MAWFEFVWHIFLRQPYRLRYSQFGSGERVVVLLHGLAANKEIWQRLIRELPSENWRILAPDLLGFGASPKPRWNNYTVQDHARAVLTLIKHLKIQKPVLLLGHSMGCLVAAHIAVRRPKLVRRVILYEPPLLGDVPQFPAHTKRSTRYKALFGYIASHPELAHFENKLLWRIARRISGLRLKPQDWLPFERSLRNTILEQQAYEDLTSINIPTDIVYGRLDFVVIRQGIAAMFRANKNIRLHLVTDIHGISARSARYLAKLLAMTAERRSKSP